MNCVCLLQLPAWHKAISTNCLTQLPCWEQPRTFVVYLVFSSCSLLSSRCHICSCFQCFQQGTVCPSWNWARAAGWVRSPSSSDKYFSKDDLQLLLSLPQPAFRREGGRSSKANKTSRSKLTIETQRPHMGPDGYSLSSVVAKLLQGGEKKNLWFVNGFKVMRGGCNFRLPSVRLGYFTSCFFFVKVYIYRRPLGVGGKFMMYHMFWFACNVLNMLPPSVRKCI